MLSRKGVAPIVVKLSFVDGVLASAKLLTRRERVAGAVLAVSMVLNGLLGLVGIALLVPFVGLLLEQDPLGRRGLMSRGFAMIGVTDVKYAIIYAGIALIVMTVLKNIYSLGHNWLVNKFSSHLEIRVAANLLERIIAAPYVWLVQHNPSMLRDVVIGHVVEWSRGVVRVGLQLVTELVFLALAISFLVVASPLAGFIVSSISVGLAILLVQMTRVRIVRAAEKKRALSRLINVTSAEAISGGRDVRMAGAGRFFAKLFRQEFAGYSQADVVGKNWQAVPRSGLEIVGLGAIVGAALIGLMAGYDREEIGGLLTLYAVVAIRAIPSIGQITSLFSALRSAIPSVSEIVGLDRELPKVPGLDEQKPLKPDWQRVILADVSVRYESAATPTLENIDLTIERSRNYAIVGSSGAGKSTLVDVIAGLILPSHGEIRVDDIKLTPKKAASWRRQVAYVAQSPFLLDANIADNIVFGIDDGRYDPVRLAAAIRSAGLQELVDSLPGGHASEVGDRGLRLSGGQRQRIAIARAIYRDADILVLDEATSALDALTEREIQESLSLLSGKTTVLMIAHRFSSVVGCDQILFLQDGRIVARGTHKELYESHPAYREMANAQAFSAVEMPIANGAPEDLVSHKGGIS